MLGEGKTVSGQSVPNLKGIVWWLVGGGAGKYTCALSVCSSTCAIQEGCSRKATVWSSLSSPVLSFFWPLFAKGLESIRCMLLSIKKNDYDGWISKKSVFKDFQCPTPHVRLFESHMSQ